MLPQDSQKITAAGAIEEIQQNLLVLRQSEKSLELIVNQLNGDFGTKDKALIQHAENWTQHWEKCFNELASQFEAIGITLTIEEKAELRNGSATYSSIQEKLKKLEALKISLADKTTAFAIMVYDTIVAVLSRNLQKIDNKAVKSIANKLDVISDENKDANQVNSDYTDLCEQNLKMLHQLEEQIANIPILPSALVEKFKAIELQAEQQISKAAEIRKLQEQQTLE